MNKFLKVNNENKKIAKDIALDFLPIIWKQTNKKINRSVPLTFWRNVMVNLELQITITLFFIIQEQRQNKYPFIYTRPTEIIYT